MAERVIIARDKYLNFPVQMLEEFMIETEYCLFQILGFAIYDTVYSENAIYETIDEFWEKTEIGSDSLIGREEELLVAGESWHIRISQLEKNPPIVGIRTDLFLDFFEQENSEFDKICLLAYLAIRSIIQKSSFRNMKMNLIKSRMAGYPGIGHSIPPEITAWMDSESRRKRIWRSLKSRYKMVMAFRAKGITCSFSLSQIELEKKRMEIKVKRSRSIKTNSRKVWEQVQKQFEVKQ